MVGKAVEPASDPVARRVDSVLGAAREYRTAVRLDQIAQLLPREGPDGVGELGAWFAAHPSVGTLVGEHAVQGPAPAREELEARRDRGLRYFAEAERVAAGLPAGLRPLVRCLVVTGSTAYGEPSANDDLDFFLVTRRGALWPVLLYEYLSARFHRSAGSGGPSHRCFNYVLDERFARSAFSASRDFLFAREALTARPVLGAQYYRGLVGSASWMEEEVPRLYTTWQAGGFPEMPAETTAPPLVRGLDLLLFPLMAAYLTLVGLRRSRRARRDGTHAPFRVEARLGRMVLATEQFEALRRLYASTAPRAAPEGA
jgi:hypothetical protein